MEGILYRTIGFDEIDVVRPLWEELNELHSSVSESFPHRFQNYTFAQRKQELCAYAEKGNLFILMATFHQQDVGYCISTFNDAATGEIQSLFLQEQCRGRGIGQELMNQSIAWLTARDAKDIVVSVVAGNEAALPFYVRHGFAPHSMQLLLKR